MVLKYVKEVFNKYDDDGSGDLSYDGTWLKISFIYPTGSFGHVGWSRESAPLRVRIISKDHLIGSALLSSKP